MSDQGMLEVLDHFESGNLPRDEFWKKMQEFHLMLRNYRSLVRRANMERIEITDLDLIIVLKNGLKVIWNPEDIRTAPNILLNHGEYEQSELHVVENLAKHCHIAFDVGANIGWYSLHLARLLRKAGGKVYAFEPVSQTFSSLTRNIELNDYEGTIHAFNLAFGESNGTVKLHIPRFSGSVAASRRQLFPNDVNQSVECPMTTFDAFVNIHGVDNIDLIKCDVEGAELFVLRGGLRTINSYKPVIMLEMLRKWARCFEYHPNEIILLLKEYGYRCWSYEDRAFSEVVEIDDECKQTNFFFFHSPQHDELIASIDSYSI